MASRRHIARVKAFQALYQLFFSMNSKLTYQQAIDQTHTGEDDDVVRQGQDDYLYFLVEGVSNNKERLDTELEKHLDNWNLSQLNSVDRLILRMGSFELLYSDVPAPAVLDEMIELSKTFSNESSNRLINGVLVALAKDSEKGEGIR